jgi:endonuclease/exonuclease/phosphatase family metal-dependent hydrolase
MTPDSVRDRRQLDESCDTLGPLFIHSRDAEGEPETAAPVAENLVLATWNTHMAAGDVNGFLERLIRGEFTGGRAAAAYVVLLQEATRTAIRRLSESSSLAVVYAPAMRIAGGPEERGNAILTNLPLTDVQVIELPFERQRRLALAVTVSGRGVDTPPWRLRVANVHLETRSSFVRGSPAAARERQVQALLSVLGASSFPMVVGGDLNTSWGEDEPGFKALRRVFPDGRRADRAPTWVGPLGLGAPLDHLVARGMPGPLEVRRLPERFGSDHHPLVAVVPRPR